MLGLRECFTLGYNLGASDNIKKTYFDKSLLATISQHLEYTLNALNDFSLLQLLSIISIVRVSMDMEHAHQWPL